MRVTGETCDDTVEDWAREIGIGLLTPVALRIRAAKLVERALNGPIKRSPRRGEEGSTDEAAVVEILVERSEVWTDRIEELKEVEDVGEKSDGESCRSHRGVRRGEGGRSELRRHKESAHAQTAFPPFLERSVSRWSADLATRKRGPSPSPFRVPPSKSFRLPLACLPSRACIAHTFAYQVGSCAGLRRAGERVLRIEAGRGERSDLGFRRGWRR